MAAKLKKQVDNTTDRALFIAKQQFNRNDLTIKGRFIRVSAPRGSSERFVERVHLKVGSQNDNDDLAFHFYNGNAYGDPTTVKMDLLTIRRSGLNQQGAASYLVCENN